MAIENVAEFCLQADEMASGECDLDEHEALVNQLLDQRAILADHIQHMDAILAKLQGNRIDTVQSEPSA